MIPPQVMVDKRAADWYSRWDRDIGQRQGGRYKQCLDMLEKEALNQEPLQPPPTQTIINYLSLIKSNRGLGLDHVKCKDIKQLPTVAIDSLRNIFGKVTNEGRWPVSQNINGVQYGNPIPVSLLDKPGGGDRPIGITPLLAALYLKSHGDITTEWDTRKMNFWEDAVKGSSALMAGLHRRLLDECAVALGQSNPGHLLGSREVL